MFYVPGIIAAIALGGLGTFKENETMAVRTDIVTEDGQRFLEYSSSVQEGLLGYPVATQSLEIGRSPENISIADRLANMRTKLGDKGSLVAQRIGLFDRCYADTDENAGRVYLSMSVKPGGKNLHPSDTELASFFGQDQKNYEIFRSRFAELEKYVHRNPEKCVRSGKTGSYYSIFGLPFAKK